MQKSRRSRRPVTTTPSPGDQNNRLPDGPGQILVSYAKPTDLLSDPLLGKRVAKLLDASVALHEGLGVPLCFGCEAALTPPRSVVWVVIMELIRNPDRRVLAALCSDCARKSELHSAMQRRFSVAGADAQFIHPGGGSA